MGILLCEQIFRNVWIRNESMRAEIGQILHTDTHPHTHTTAAKLVVRVICHMLTATYVYKMPRLRLIYYNLMDATIFYISFIYLILKCKSQYKYMLLNHAQMR